MYSWAWVWPSPGNSHHQDYTIFTVGFTKGSRVSNLRASLGSILWPYTSFCFLTQLPWSQRSLAVFCKRFSDQNPGWLIFHIGYVIILQGSMRMIYFYLALFKLICLLSTTVFIAIQSSSNYHEMEHISFQPSWRSQWKTPLFFHQKSQCQGQ